MRYKTPEDQVLPLLGRSLLPSVFQVLPPCGSRGGHCPSAAQQVRLPYLSRGPQGEGRRASDSVRAHGSGLRQPGTCPWRFTV